MPKKYTFKRSSNNRSGYYNHDSGYESGYESDGGTLYRPEKDFLGQEKTLGKGNYSRARLFKSTQNTKNIVVLDPAVPQKITPWEIEKKFSFYKALYPQHLVDKIDKNGTFRMILPLIPGQSYEEYKDKSEDQDQTLQIKLFLSTVRALKNCHAKGYVFIDLKEDNIHYDAKTNTSYLIDGGMATAINTPIERSVFTLKDEQTVQTYRTKYFQIPPECWSVKTPAHAQVTMDIFPLGSMMSRVLHKPADDLKTMIKNCQNPNPKDRPTLDELETALLNLLPQKAPTPESSIKPTTQTVLSTRDHFDRQLAIITNKIEYFQKNHYNSAAQTGLALHNTLFNAGLSYFQGQTTADEFKKTCQKAIALARPELEKYRGWKLIFANLALLVAGLGIGYLAVTTGYFAVTGKWPSLLRTHSAKQLDAFEEEIKHITP